MPTNQIKQFAAGSGANALTPAAYAALTTLISKGFQSGKADSVKFNTVLRQSSFIATMIAQFVCDTAGANVNDDGDLTTLKNNFVAAIDALIATETTRAENAEMSLSIALAAEITRAETAEALLAPRASPALTGNPTAPTQSLGDNSTKLATTAFVQANIDALGGLITSNYAVLPGGIIIQRVVASSSGSWPITFPNGFYGGVGTFKNVLFASTNTHIGVDGDASTFTLTFGADNSGPATIFGFGY